MGQAKKEQLEREEDSARRWQTKCQIEGWKCSRCESLPPFEEREIFFETGKGLCGYCAHIISKDD